MQLGSSTTRMEFETKLPLGAATAKDDLYMDDLMSGGKTVEDVIKLITKPSCC